MEILDESFKQFFNLLNVNKKSFDFFDIIPPKEVLVSKWIEFILNPELNGVGNLPVKKLLELVDSNESLDELEFESIDTEVSTNEFKRIDILIKYNGLWVVIENKIESYENGEQTNDYFNYIESIKENNEVIYIYLKPNYNHSIPRNSSFEMITYDKFINKLKEISEFDYKEKEKYKYLKEFIISGGRFMNNEELEMTDSLRFYINNIDKFEAIQEEYKMKNKSLVSKISNTVLDTLNEQNSRYECTKGTNTFIQFYKDNWNNRGNQGVHFEIYFGTTNIIGKVLNAKVVLHIEKNTTEEELLKLEKNGITVKSTLGYYYDKAIEEIVPVDFTTIENINKSVDRLVLVLKDYQYKYESIIDKISNKT